MLDLAQSRTYTKGKISGFSAGESIDLRDIGFVSAGEASFKGDASGGTLTVTDGSHTAKIALFGNYMASTFATKSDGHGGALVSIAASAQPMLAVSH